jgi:hypothetical protein
MKGGGSVLRIQAKQSRVPVRVVGDGIGMEGKVYQASQNGAEDGQGGVPVAEAHHLKGGLREPEKEVDKDEGRDQYKQHDDDGQRQEEKFEQL